MCVPERMPECVPELISLACVFLTLPKLGIVRPPLGRSVAWEGEGDDFKVREHIGW